MNMFDYAMQMEKDGEVFYRELAEKTGSSGLKNIFITLAENEVQHYNTFKAMKENSDYNFKETQILNESKNIFIKLKEQGVEASVSKQKEAYEKALEIEKQSIEYYEGLLQKEIKSDVQKNVISKIKEEEKKHYFLIENIIEFVSRPETWLENAEFNHLDEY
jgi:rubrerythrin